MAYIIFIAVILLYWYFSESIYDLFFNNKKIIKRFSVVCSSIGFLMFFPFLYVENSSPTLLGAGLVLFLIGFLPFAMYSKTEREEGTSLNDENSIFSSDDNDDDDLPESAKRRRRMKNK